MGKSKCQLLPFIDQTHSMEGIEPLPDEGELECLELARPQPAITSELESELRGRPQPLLANLSLVSGLSPLRVCSRHSPDNLSLGRFQVCNRRCHLNPSTALQSCTQVEINKEDKLLIMFLLLTFGGKLCPSEWSALAEPICDLAQLYSTSDGIQQCWRHPHTVKGQDSSW